MTSPLHFAPQAYPGGRIVLKLGMHDVGAVIWNKRPPAIEGGKG